MGVSEIAVPRRKSPERKLGEIYRPSPLFPFQSAIFICALLPPPYTDFEFYEQRFPGKCTHEIPERIHRE